MLCSPPASKPTHSGRYPNDTLAFKASSKSSVGPSGSVGADADAAIAGSRLRPSPHFFRRRSSRFLRRWSRMRARRASLKLDAGTANCGTGDDGCDSRTSSSLRPPSEDPHSVPLPLSLSLSPSRNCRGLLACTDATVLKWMMDAATSAAIGSIRLRRRVGLTLGGGVGGFCTSCSRTHAA